MKLIYPKNFKEKNAKVAVIEVSKTTLEPISNIIMKLTQLEKQLEFVREYYNLRLS